VRQFRHERRLPSLHDHSTPVFAALNPDDEVAAHGLGMEADGVDERPE